METQNIHKQYITDDKGKKTAIIIPIDEYEELMEDLHDLSVAAERRDEPLIELKDIKKNIL